MTRSIVRGVAAGLLVLAIAGCGSSDEPSNAAAAEELQVRVAEIRSLATARQPAEVAAKLDQLLARVDELRADDELSEPAAADIRAAAEAVAGQLTLITTTTTAPPTTVIVTVPVAPKDGKGKDDGEDEGKGKGKKDD